MENMNKAMIVACVAILPGAVWSGAQLSKPKVTLDESWLIDRVPDIVPGYRLLPSDTNPKTTYKMDPETYAELEPIGITAQIYRDAQGHEFEAVVIAGQDMATFHDQRVCFTTQGWSLTKDAKEALDQLAGEISKTKGYLVAVEGGADGIGASDYNYDLSQRRATAVIQYLASQHSVPAYKIYVIGLGKDKPVESNKTADGRAKNRRVDVRLMTNVAGGDVPAAPAAAPAATNPGTN